MQTLSVIQLSALNYLLTNTNIYDIIKEIFKNKKNKYNEKFQQNQQICIGHDDHIPVLFRILSC